MLKDIQDSIKAKLYDFTYSPFMSSMIISWIIINHKYILIYMASYDLDKKLALLKQYDFTWHITWFHVPWVFNIWIPILFGLFYTFLYPTASKKFYEYTLEKNKELKKIKQNIEDVTPITQEEARTLRESIRNLTEINYGLEKSVIESEDRYKKKVKELNTKNINQEIFQYGKNKGEDKKLSETTKNNEDDTTRVLRFFYESNYKFAELDELLDEIFKREKIARPKAKMIVDKLLKDDTLVYDNYEQIIISAKGNKMLLKLFDKEK